MQPICPARVARSRPSASGRSAAPGLGLLAWCLAGSAAAVDLRNEDDRSYEIRVEDGATTLHTSISPNTTRIDLTRTGTVIVVGAGSFRADGLREVRIRAGILHFE